MTHIQHRVQPLVNKNYNAIEIKAMLASSMTLYRGIIFEQEDAQEKYQNFFIVFYITFIMITNIIFIIEWLYLIIQALNIKHPFVQILLQIIASLLLKRHKVYKIQESEEVDNIIEINKEELK